MAEVDGDPDEHRRTFPPSLFADAALCLYELACVTPKDERTPRRRRPEQGLERWAVQDSNLPLGIKSPIRTAASRSRRLKVAATSAIARGNVVQGHAPCGDKHALSFVLPLVVDSQRTSSSWPLFAVPRGGAGTTGRGPPPCASSALRERDEPPTNGREVRDWAAGAERRGHESATSSREDVLRAFAAHGDIDFAYPTHASTTTCSRASEGGRRRRTRTRWFGGRTPTSAPVPRGHWRSDAGRRSDVESRERRLDARAYANDQRRSSPGTSGSATVCALTGPPRAGPMTRKAPNVKRGEHDVPELRGSNGATRRPRFLTWMRAAGDT